MPDRAGAVMLRRTPSQFGERWQGVVGSASQRTAACRHRHRSAAAAVRCAKRLLEARPSPYGRMQVITTDQFAGRRYLCRCGWVGWSVWGHARRHATRCPEAGRA